MVTSDKQDLLQAMDTVVGFFDRWHQEGRLTQEQHQTLTSYYKENRGRVETGGPPTEEMTLRNRSVCWSCKGTDPRADEYCPDCGAPLKLADVERLRTLTFLCFEVKKHEAAGRIPLAVSHDLMAEGNDRIAFLRRRLEEDRLPLVKAVSPRAAVSASTPLTVERVPRKRRFDRPPREEIEEKVEPAAPRRSVIEILLDPRTIQWLLACGGALLVLGLVIYLASIKFFEDPRFVAVALGLGNLALLAGGWALIYYTRHQIAGRAVTLLACLVMPLNLWFYDAQGLVPLRDGWLWLPALVCCVLYAASARLLKDAMFVPVFVLGVTLTGLLMLPQELFIKFWDATGSATLLVAFGLVCIHAERAFPVYDGPFSRRRFGLMFFWSGHALLGCGLLLLFCAQLFGGWLFDVVRPIYDRLGVIQPEIVRTQWGKWLALGLVLGGTYAYVYSDLVVRRVGVYMYVSVFTLLWAEVLFITIVADRMPAEVVIIALALTGLLWNFAVVTMTKQQTMLTTRVGAPLALFLCGLPVLLGLVLHFQATLFRSPLMHKLDWEYVIAMAVTAASCRIGAYLYRHEMKVISTTYHFGAAAALMAGAAGILVVASAGTMPWQEQAPLLMIIPILYLIASRLYRGHTAAVPLGWVAHAATAAMLFFSLGTAFRGFTQVSGDQLNLLLALFFAEATVFYAIAAVTREKWLNVYFGTAAACAMVWQLLKYANIPDEWYTLAFASVGLVLLILYRFAVLERYGGGLAEAAFQCANALLLLAFTAAALMTANDLLLNLSPMSDNLGAKPLLIAMLLTMVASSLVAVGLVRHQGWRRFYVAAAAVNAALAALVLVTLGDLTLGQKVEIAALVVGVLMLAAGHFGWYREQERQDDLTSIELVFGSLLVALPFSIAIVANRWSKPAETWFLLMNEIGMLVMGLLMLGTGYACRLKATTLAGAFMMAVYVLSLVLFLRIPERLQSAAVYMMIGGGVFFGVGLLLSIYRDRLLTLPKRIKRREGVFRVLSWR
jgi:hypothetical protein